MWDLSSYVEQSHAPKRAESVSGATYQTAHLCQGIALNCRNLFATDNVADMSASGARAPKRATLRVVARAAGVSTATASKVLNHRPDVAESTRRRVEAALREHGYEPTTGPRGTAADQVVSVVFDTLENTYSTQVLRGILAAAEEMDLGIVVEELFPVDTPREDNLGARLTPAWIRAAAHRRFGVLTVTT